ncbi:MAG: hypothetical protein RBR24_08665 [Candidatus Carbobacillus sp.]|nr:hypothetical protein [Candidatus Carbobacillus sp.]
MFSFIWPSFLFALTELDNALILLAILRRTHLLSPGLIIIWLSLFALIRTFFLKEMSFILNQPFVRFVLVVYLFFLTYRLFRDGFLKSDISRTVPKHDSFWTWFRQFLSVTVVLLIVDTSLGFDQMASGALLYQEPLRMFFNIFLSKLLALSAILFLPESLAQHPWISHGSAFLIGWTASYVWLATVVPTYTLAWIGMGSNMLLMYFAWRHTHRDDDKKIK